MARPPQLISHRSYDAEITALFTLFDSRHEGSLFTYTEIQTATSLKYGVSPWDTIIGRFRKLYLQQRGVAIRCEKGVGYRTLTPQQQLENDDHRRRSLRAMQRDFAEKVYIKDEKLTEPQRRLQAALTHQATSDIQQIRYHQAERKSFLASSEGVNNYLRTNEIRPRAVLIQEEEAAQEQEGHPQPDALPDDPQSDGPVG